jgi:hypothetical protein
MTREVAMRTAAQAAAWAKGMDGETGWRRKCLIFVRSAWDLPAQDESAQLEWNSIPGSARHPGNRPPLGAPCFWKGPLPQGHVAIVVEYRGDVPYIASNDILVRGRIDIVPLAKIEQGWTSSRWLGWSTVLQGHTLPLGQVGAQAVDGHDAFRQGGKVYRSKMRSGQRDSDSVWNLQLALIRKGHSIGAPHPTGDYLDGTRKAVAAFQRNQGWTGADADGIAGKTSITRLRLVWVDD